MDELIGLYRKTNGGQTILSEKDFKRYTELRKKEFQDSRDKLLKEGKTDIHPCKDEAGDIIGWVFEDPEHIS